MNWEEIDGKLEKNFKFNSQTELAEFIVKIAKYADQINHHPDYNIHKAYQLQIRIFSHDLNKITPLDYQLANYISALKN